MYLLAGIIVVVVVVLYNPKLITNLTFSTSVLTSYCIHIRNFLVDLYFEDNK